MDMAERAMEEARAASEKADRISETCCGRK
jgi:hypothetical protein